MRFRIIASRHSAFYAPLLNCICMLRDEGHQVIYTVLQPGQRSYALLRDREVDVMQSAVSSNWSLLEQGIDLLPVHFAQINQRDGLFIIGRQREPAFQWKNLEGKTLLADHGLQPLVMLKYALKQNGVDWEKIKVVDAGTPEQMSGTFLDGAADYVHLQGPVVAGGEVIASVGASMAPVAFSSLCCARSYQETEDYCMFLEAYERAKSWVRVASGDEIAAKQANFFPGVPIGTLADAVCRYHDFGCWDGGVEIPLELYDVIRRDSYPLNRPFFSS